MEFNFQCLLCYKDVLGDAALSSDVRKINLLLFFFKSQIPVIAPWKLISDVIQTGKPRMNARQHTGEMVSNSLALRSTLQKDVFNLQ